jgi:hypothetical protein
MANNFKNPWEQNQWAQGGEEYKKSAVGTEYLPENSAYRTGINPNTGESVEEYKERMLDGGNNSSINNIYGGPKSVIEEMYRETTTKVNRGNGDDLWDAPPITITFTTITYRFTEGATHLLSLVSGVDEFKIYNTEIRNAQASMLPAYDPYKGGGAITFPSTNPNMYRMNFTANFFTTEKYGRTAYGNNVMRWLRLASHEVGHIRDIDEIGGRIKYFGTFIGGYAKSKGHDKYWREQRAEGGTKEFDAFVTFVNSYYGNGKLKDLFENENNSQTDIIERINQWWSKYKGL